MTFITRQSVEERRWKFICEVVGGPADGTYEEERDWQDSDERNEVVVDLAQALAFYCRISPTVGHYNMSDCLVVDGAVVVRFEYEHPARGCRKLWRAIAAFVQYGSFRVIPIRRIPARRMNR